MLIQNLCQLIALRCGFQVGQNLQCGFVNMEAKPPFVAVVNSGTDQTMKTRPDVFDVRLDFFSVSRELSEVESNLWKIVFEFNSLAEIEIETSNWTHDIYLMISTIDEGPRYESIDSNGNIVYKMRMTFKVKIIKKQ